MTTMTAPAPTPTPAAPAEDPPAPLQWTREEYYRLAEAGFFAGRRVMLIEGRVYTMSPQNEPHSRGIVAVLNALQAAFGTNFTFRPQLPLDLRQTSDPEPDMAVIAGPHRSQPTTRPTAAVLIVEVADSSLAFDSGDKASLYAAAGITDYWVVDLAHDRLIVFRDPRPDATAPHGHSYFQIICRGPADTVAPLAAPNSPITVADLWP